MKRLFLATGLLMVLAFIPCTQAHQACVAQEEFEYESCMQLENDGPKCLERSGRIYNECMAAHGCPIIN